MDDSSVKVLLRIRPRSAREIIDGCQVCTVVDPIEPQVLIGGSDSFTFDFVLDSGVEQEKVYSIVEPLVDGCLEGYNATILAYGQTGSGKTYTMGTGFDAEHNEAGSVLPSQGILPRALHHLFSRIDLLSQNALDLNQPPPRVTVKAQFVELYNEEINDLMDSFSLKPKNGIKIHEDTNGGIYLVGVGTKEVNSTGEAMAYLRDGALIRSTASTNMNDSSSRSHAVFTLHIFQQRLIQPCNEDLSEPEFENLSAKFHFVDLAGSERLKRTGAVGDRAREGISINCGLLALGNVISALGDRSKKALHIPYRDSKLTRLLQDSLGGNSRTIMIACVSPCDRDFVETISTLKYANRARNIKNKVTINQDKSSRIISSLRLEIATLKAQLQDYKQGKREAGINENDFNTDYYHENLLLTAELEKLRHRVHALQQTVERITASNAVLLAEKASGSWLGSSEFPNINKLILGYTQNIEELRGKLLETEAMSSILKKKQKATLNILNKSLSPRSKVLMTSRPGSAEPESQLYPSVTDLILAAKSEVRNDEKKKLNLLKSLNKTSEDINGKKAKDDEEEGLSSGDSQSEEVLDTERATEEELANISEEIDTKQKLIEQLELSNKRVLETREQYEQQITILLTKMKHTEEERDAMLSGFKGLPSGSDGKMKQLKDDYERKLAEIQRDLHRMKEALREHNLLVAKNASAEKQVVKLKAEVDSMRRFKIKLQNQLREEHVKFREVDVKKQKEILQLKKDQRKKEIQIRTLENKNQLKEQILKRKHEEVAVLKKQAKSGLSRRAAGKAAVPTAQHKRGAASPAKAKKKWNELKSALCRKLSDRKALEQLESEMLVHIKSRKKVKEQMDMILRTKDNADLSIEEINELNDELDSLSASFKYSDEQVCLNQRAICELTSLSPKVDIDHGMLDISLAMEHFSREDCEYLMKKMYEYTVENLTYTRDTATKLSIAEQNVETLNQELATLKDVLSHVWGKYCLNSPNTTIDLPGKVKNEIYETITKSSAVDSVQISPVQEPVMHEIPAAVSSNSNPMAEESRSLSKNSNVSLLASSTNAVTQDIGVKRGNRSSRRLTSTPRELLGLLRPGSEHHKLRNLQEESVGVASPVNGIGNSFRSKTICNSEFETAPTENFDFDTTFISEA